MLKTSQLCSQAEGLFARLRATPEQLATAQAKYDQLLQDPLVGLELVRSARRYLLSLQRRSRPYGWLYAPLAIAPLGALYPLAVRSGLQAMVNSYPMGLAALLAIDVAVVVLVDVVITLMGRGAPHLWLPGGLATLIIDIISISLKEYRLLVCLANGQRII